MEEGKRSLSVLDYKNLITRTGLPEPAIDSEKEYRGVTEFGFVWLTEHWKVEARVTQGRDVLVYILVSPKQRLFNVMRKVGASVYRDTFSVRPEGYSSFMEAMFVLGTILKECDTKLAA